MRRVVSLLVLAIAIVTASAGRTRASIPVDLSKYDANSPIKVDHEGDQLSVQWNGQSHGILQEPPGPIVSRVEFDLRPGKPLLASLAADRSGKLGTLPSMATGLNPVWYLTVGTREAEGGKPPETIWQTFFDKPANRTHETYLVQLELQRASIASRGTRVIVRFEKASAGSFTGALEFTFFAGSPLVLAEAILSTTQDRRAIIYDAGLVAEKDKTGGWRQFGWVDAEKKSHGVEATKTGASEPQYPASRVICAEGEHGAVALFPPPHQFQYPRDWSNNFGNAWLGTNHFGKTPGVGFGIRSEKAGGGAFVPWFNAPPGSEQRLGFFLAFSPKGSAHARLMALAYTHNDRFEPLPGYTTFSSHWHMAVAMAAMEAMSKSRNTPPVPEFVEMFKRMNVNIVHLGEFHGDGHQKDPGPLRLPELHALFAECRRLSDDKLLLLPGEEVNEFFGLEEKGKHPGHWMSFFPKPVYWTQRRGPKEPFVTEHPQYGRVYHVCDRADMFRLMQEEHGLAWTAHPRIKASSWTPDIFRQEDFYLADFWLGAAWKAMPGDLAHDRLGRRGLDLLDDMANWGQKKYLPGEVDVFKLDHTHELYGHMNVNYLRVKSIPKFDNGWQSILDCLRDGRFFVTTGEVLIPKFTVDGEESGSTVKLAGRPASNVEVELSWTFPLAFAEIISGDGAKVERTRIDLSDTRAFGSKPFTFTPRLLGKRWVRFEVWDVAHNGAYTQPVWLSE